MASRLLSTLTGGAFVVFLAVSVLQAQIIVYPCPWAPESARTAQGNIADGITFANLPAEGELLIYTLDGTLVRQAQFNDASRKYKWFGKNDDGQDVASGVYFWVVKSAEGTKTGKFIVAR